MKDLLKKDLMILDLLADDKLSAIDEIAGRFYAQGYVKSKEDFRQGLIEREEECSTALGDGVAIPHSKNATVKEPAVLFARKKGGLDYASLDGRATEIFFAIAAPEGENNLHLSTLAELAKMMLQPGFVDALKQVEHPEEVYDILARFQGQNERASESILPVPKEDAPYLLAVTACPNGIAHTYMAQEAIEKAAQARGAYIKVETNGSDGIKNRLTAKEIARADVIILAADKKVETARFDGKKVIQRSVSDGIRKADEIVARAIAGEAPVYHEEGAQLASEATGTESIGRRIYRDLMNGISHMLPFVIGGGILLALSFLLERFVGHDSTAFHFLNSLGGDAFQFLIPVLAAYIAYSIGDRPALMPGMVAGLMASRGAGFIGGLIGGFLAGYLVTYLKKLCRKLPKSVEGLKPMLIYPVLGLLLVGALMYFLVNPVFTGINHFINASLTGLGGANRVFLGALLAGMMAADMGGPINKAAYAFAIGAFTDTGIGTFMAAVMVGGMVPPIAIAIATSVFRKKFTEEQKKTTITNYILGASFITEGAIPFAAAEPQLVLPTCILGSALAGALVGYFGVSAPAPHGGIFILPAMSSLQHALLFVGAVLAGAVVAGLLYGLLKKAKPEVGA